MQSNAACSKTLQTLNLCGSDRLTVRFTCCLTAKRLVRIDLARCRACCLQGSSLQAIAARCAALTALDFGYAFQVLPPSLTTQARRLCQSRCHVHSRLLLLCRCTTERWRRWRSGVRSSRRWERACAGQHWPTSLCSSSVVRSMLSMVTDAHVARFAPLCLAVLRVFPREMRAVLSCLPD